MPKELLNPTNLHKKIMGEVQGSSLRKPRAHSTLTDKNGGVIEVLTKQQYDKLDFTILTGNDPNKEVGFVSEGTIYTTSTGDRKMHTHNKSGDADDLSVG